MKATRHIIFKSSYELRVLLIFIVVYINLIKYILIQYVAFKDRLVDLSIDYAIIDYELKTTNENVDMLEHTLKVLIFKHL